MASICERLKALEAAICDECVTLAQIQAMIDEINDEHCDECFTTAQIQGWIADAIAALEDEHCDECQTEAEIRSWIADAIAAIPDPPAHPAFSRELCSPNHIRRYAGFQGQIFPVTATNFNDDILGWLPTQTFTAACDGFVVATLEQPWGRTGVRDSMNQTYVDIRLMVNGNQVELTPNYVLWENWHPEVAGANNNVRWEEHSYSITYCRAVSAGDVVHIEHRYKSRILRDTGPNTYNRLLVYRERATFFVVPSPVVTEVSHP